jgi:hypothetical protein
MVDRSGGQHMAIERRYLGLGIDRRMIERGGNDPDDLGRIAGTQDQVDIFHLSIDHRFRKVQRSSDFGAALADRDGTGDCKLPITEPEQIVQLRGSGMMIADRKNLSDDQRDRVQPQLDLDLGEHVARRNIGNAR